MVDGLAASCCSSKWTDDLVSGDDLVKADDLAAVDGLVASSSSSSIMTADALRTRASAFVGAAVGGGVRTNCYSKM